MRMFHDRSNTGNEGNMSQRGRKKSLSDGVNLMTNLQLSSQSSSEIFHSSARLSDAAADQLCNIDENGGSGMRDFLSQKEEPPPVSVRINQSLIDIIRTFRCYKIICIIQSP
jgi:hypothetical protein